MRLRIRQYQRRGGLPSDQHLITGIETAGESFGMLGRTHENLAEAFRFDQVFGLLAKENTVLDSRRRFDVGVEWRAVAGIRWMAAPVAYVLRSQNPSLAGDCMYPPRYKNGYSTL